MRPNCNGYCPKGRHATFKNSSKRHATIDAEQKIVETKQAANSRTKPMVQSCDSLDIFQNAFEVVVYSLETLKDDGNEKTSMLLVAIRTRYR